MLLNYNKEKYSFLNYKSMIWVPSKRRIPTDTRHENVCLIWERKGEQFLGLWLKTERHHACEWGLPGFMHTSHIGHHLYVPSLCGIIFLVQKMSYKATKSEHLGIFHTLKSNWWGWQFVLTQEIIKKNVFTMTSSLIGIYESSCSYYISFTLRKISHIKWDFQILLNNKQLQHFY